MSTTTQTTARRDAAYFEFPWALVDTELGGIDDIYATKSEAEADLMPGQTVEYVGTPYSFE